VGGASAMRGGVTVEDEGISTCKRILSNRSKNER